MNSFYELLKKIIDTLNLTVKSVQQGFTDAQKAQIRDNIDALGKNDPIPVPTPEQVGADPEGTAASLVSDHNVDTAAHNDIRDALNDFMARVNTLLDSDDTTLDQLSEIVDYIKNNKDLIEGVTTGKVSVDDIVDNLTSNISNQPLSAAQGVVLKGLIDDLAIAIENKSALTDSEISTLTAMIM